MTLYWPENVFGKDRRKPETGITREEYANQHGISGSEAYRQLEAKVAAGAARKIRGNLPTGKRVPIMRYILKPPGDTQ